MKKSTVLVVLSSLLFIGLVAIGEAKEEESFDEQQDTLRLIEKFFKRGEEEGEEEGHTQNWAVLVCTSKFWYNYRHTTNTLAVYRALKKFGLADSNIILMLAEDTACNPRNPFPSKLFATTQEEEEEEEGEDEDKDEYEESNEEEDEEQERVNIYGEDIEVDYRGAEVSVENFLRLLTGRHSSSETPRSKRLLTDSRSNLLIYLTGHGGEDFMKFQNMEEVVGKELANAVEQLYQQQRYHSLLFMADTCQAASLFKHFNSPNVVAIGSSKTGESSYSYRNDFVIGAALIDRFTFYTMTYLDKYLGTEQSDRRVLYTNAKYDNTSSLLSLFTSFEYSHVYSTPEWKTTSRTPKLGRDESESVDEEEEVSWLASVPITDFFGSNVKVFLDI